MRCLPTLRKKKTKQTRSVTQAKAEKKKKSKFISRTDLLGNTMRKLLRVQTELSEEYGVPPPAPTGGIFPMPVAGPSNYNKKNVGAGSKRKREADDDYETQMSPKKPKIEA